MIKKLLTLLLISTPLLLRAQTEIKNGVTFRVENLSKPTALLPVESFEDVCKLAIVNRYKIDTSDFPFQIKAVSKANDKIVNFREHAFLNTIYQAYAEHRPVVLSPDIMWLLISQGFMQHLNLHSEDLRKNFVEFGRKKELVATFEKDNWDAIFPQFSKQIAKYTGTDLMNNLSCNFTTTTPTDVIASQINIMGGMSSYFDFVAIRIVCGIPEFTLLGTTNDWELLVDKVHYLGQRFEMDWWTGKIERIMKEFVRASRGNVNKDFWREMFKYHTSEVYGKPGVIDGWIATFFPYDIDGNLLDMKEINDIGKLPKQYVTVDFKLIDQATKKKSDMEVWAGFFGAEQSDANFALKPAVGWFIREKDSAKELEITLKRNKNVVLKNIKTIPEEFLAQKRIPFLQVIFDGKINIPDQLAKVEIDRLNLHGEIDTRGVERIQKLFPKAIITINSEKIQ